MPPPSRQRTVERRSTEPRPRPLLLVVATQCCEEAVLLDEREGLRLGPGEYVAGLSVQPSNEDPSGSPGGVISCVVWWWS